jgi:type I restriction enzyme M protein
LIVDGSQRFTKGRNQNQMDLADIEAIITAYRSEVSTDKHVLARLVDHTEIKESGWDLNLGRYLMTAEKDTTGVAQALAALRQTREVLRIAEAKLDKRLKAAGYEW